MQTRSMIGYVFGLEEIDHTQVAVVGGKGAHLGELSRIEGLRVPPGFCVTTDAFRRIMVEAPSMHDRLDRLSRVNPDDRNLCVVDLLETEHIPDHRPRLHLCPSMVASAGEPTATIQSTIGVLAARPHP